MLVGGKKIGYAEKRFHSFLPTHLTPSSFFQYLSFLIPSPNLNLATLFLCFFHSSFLLILLLFYLSSYPLSYLSRSCSSLSLSSNCLLTLSPSSLLILTSIIRLVEQNEHRPLRGHTRYITDRILQKSTTREIYASSGNFDKVAAASLAISVVSPRRIANAPSCGDLINSQTKPRYICPPLVAFAP